MMYVSEFLGLTAKRAKEFLKKASRRELERMLGEIYKEERR